MSSQLGFYHLTLTILARKDGCGWVLEKTDGFKQGLLGGSAGDLLDCGSRVGISLCVSCGKANLCLSFINLSCGGVGGPGIFVVGAWSCPLQCLFMWGLLQLGL